MRRPEDTESTEMHISSSMILNSVRSYVVTSRVPNIMVHQIKYIASNLGIPLTRVLMNVLHYWVMGIPSAVPSMPIERGRMGFRGVSWFRGRP